MTNGHPELASNNWIRIGYMARVIIVIMNILLYQSVFIYVLLPKTEPLENSVVCSYHRNFYKRHRYSCHAISYYAVRKKS